MVQRIGLARWSYNLTSQSTLNTTNTQLSSQLSQAMFNYKKQLIVNDKYGMFALIVFPFSDDSICLNESHKYQFNSLKFVDKQTLSSSHNR